MDCHTVPIECLICAEPCDALAVFKCGHYVCYVCGLHIHSIAHAACPVCRKVGNTVVVTQMLPTGKNGEDQFSTESFQAMEAESIFDETLRCHVHGEALADEMTKMYSYVCPVPKCWFRGRQEPFYELSVLKEHLKVDHGVEYCPICLEHRSAFLCEQQVYSRDALQLHMKGACPLDTPSFLGHPCCKFCQNTRFYDEEHLLNHMKHTHFTCDICNRGEFRFTYYKDRAKLLLHFKHEHQLCDHPACASLDPMARVFASDLELAFHNQRVHGVRSRLTLFTADTAPTASMNTSGSGGGSLYTSTAPATGLNANAIHVIFDHVSRRETVELTPTRTLTETQKQVLKYRNGRNKITNIAPRDAPGLPTHFRKTGVLKPLMRLERRRVASPNAELHPRAFGMPEKAGNCHTKNVLPSDNAELRRALDAALKQELNGTHQLNEFRACTAEFLGGKMLTTAYYNCLRDDFFPSEAAFEAVFPLLIATMPVSEKREALVQIERMRNSPEVQRVHRVQEEEARKQAEDEKWRRQHSLARNLQEKSGRRKGNNNKGRNVWLERGSAVLIEQQRNRQPNSTVGNENSNNNRGNEVSMNNRPSFAAVTTASSHNTSAAPMQQQQQQQQRRQAPLVYNNTGYYQDPEDFPSLPSTGADPQPNAQWARRTQQPNAWLRR